ncbi:MAG: hypothetical protein MRJ92_08150 [Nitrospira sp.]|nr:hypothetical protein [Nitrospira sp.]
MHRPLAARFIVAALSTASLLSAPTGSPAQGGGGQVTVTPTPGKVIAWSPQAAASRSLCRQGESIVTSGSRGHTGFVHTSHRLLGFSAGLRQWRDVRLGRRCERLGRYQFLILAHTNQQVLGFQATRGHWTSMALGPNETVSHLRGHGHVAVAITNERALGFSTYTGGFFVIAWTPQNGCWSTGAECHGGPHINAHSHASIPIQRLDWSDNRRSLSH